MSEQRVLVIEDNPSFQVFVKEVLRSDEFSLAFSSNGKDARKTCAQTAFDLILLDLSLPDCGGLEVFAELRKDSKNKTTPIVFLTASSTLSNKVAAFALGADDYIVKDVDPLEFRSRVEAKLRNLRKGASSSLSLQRGALKIDLSSHRAYLVQDGIDHDLGLTALEFRLLHFLARNEGKTFSREQILSSVWGGDVHVFDRAVDTHVYLLRKKLADKGELIEAIQNVGYRFVPSKS